MFPISPYQQKLIQFGSEIIKLWWWDPTPKMIEDCEKVAVGKKRKHQSDLRDPGPEPIASIRTTFLQFRGPRRLPLLPRNLPSALPRTSSFRLISGTIPLVSWTAYAIVTSANERSAKSTNKGLVATSQVTSASGKTAEGAEDLDETNNVDGFDVKSWSENVVNCEPELLPPLLPLHSTGVSSVAQASMIY
jgi:hypothetical protein